jgi:MFS family permease
MRRTVLVLGTAQTLAWAASYYLVAILAVPMAADLGIAATSVYAAFSAALLVAAVLGPRVGRTIDALGGREVLAVSNLALAAGLVLLATARSEVMLWCGWGVMGIGMGLGLYDAAFAALTRLYAEEARRAITGITLIAGFASTVGFPLSAWGEAELGWRGTCLAWAAVQVFIALPLNRFGVPGIHTSPQSREAALRARVPLDRNMWVLGFVFCASWFVTASMAVHLPQLLIAAGASTATAIAAASLIGPSQVAARLFEAGLQSRMHPLTSLRVALLGHPLGAVALLLSGGTLPFLFVILHGGGNGVLTIARGTVPLAVFGPENYGLRTGLLGAPARFGQAFAPLLFGLLMVPLGTGVLWVSTGLMLAALAALGWLRLSRPVS